jgi:hypothetical protein
VRTTLIVAFLFASCGSPRPEPRAEPSSPSDPSSPSEHETPVVAIHEWGLIDVDLASGTAELSAGPGMPSTPVMARKPVLYLHLLEGDAQSLTVRARVPGGRILEHWPAGELAADSIAWNVGVRRGPCGEAGRGPAREARDTTCQSVDGFCETPELPRYVTTDHDCLDVAGTEASLLFYRASVDASALPLRVERANDLSVRITSLRDGWDGPRNIVRVSRGLVGTWPLGRAMTARATIPRHGETAVMPVGETMLDPAAERETMARVLTELGLTTSEAEAFVGAWAETLFPAGGDTRRWSQHPSEDVLLYWLSQADVARFAVIDASPAAITLSRAFLVRITFPPTPAR